MRPVQASHLAFLERVDPLERRARGGGRRSPGVDLESPQEMLEGRGRLIEVLEKNQARK